MSCRRVLATLAVAAAVASAAPVDLSRGWRVLQDVHDMGETLRLWRRASHGSGKNTAVSDWEPIPRLDYLQLLFAPQPYFGRELRYFNQAPWWYRLEFPTPPETSGATLRFEGVDYYAKVWLNEKLLGEHEGYQDPFEFEVGPLLERGRPNVLTVKVSSPWDDAYLPGRSADRVHCVIRRMIKGTYEHADTFVQRDVNPIGIWRPVELLPHGGLRAAGDPAIVTTLAQNSAAVSVRVPVALDGGERNVGYAVRILSDRDGTEVARAVKTVRLAAGEQRLEAALTVPSPRLWSTWDRGEPYLYRAEIEVREAGRTLLARSIPFGIRTVDLRRTASETTLLLNGKPLYLRGATYWPDEYISKSDRGRYEHDVANAVRAGMNAFRIHVHIENPEFYEVCDRMGLVVFQDFDLNWVFPTDEAFTARAVTLFRSVVRRLRNHPSIACWIAMNETGRLPAATLRPGPQLVAAARELDPTRPVIKNSEDRKDLESGDAHDYRGSLGRGRYTDIYGSSDKLVTEFGVDAPPPFERFRAVPPAAELLKKVLPRVAELHDYQYRLIKYYVEHYRIQKYAPNSGYFQFMWIDFCPQSFYGVYDYWGYPKSEGIGGGLRALEESNQPVGIFMEHKDAPVALHAVNDTPADLGDCTASWLAATDSGEVIRRGSATVPVGPDSHVRIGDFSFPVKQDAIYRVTLDLVNAAGRTVAHNVYRDPFHRPGLPEGHPVRMDHEVGMRLWWGGEGQ